MSHPLSQEEADDLLNMDKKCFVDTKFTFPGPGNSLQIPLVSVDRHEEFMLDITRGRIALKKCSFQERARKTIVLARVDIGGAPHRNPDGAEIPSPHIHVYREGFDDKWAMPLPQYFSKIEDLRNVLDQFMDFCHICKKPNIEYGLYEFEK